MTTQPRKCNLSNEDLIERCNEWVSKLAKSGGRDWRLHVPVSFNTDPDMLFCELSNRFKELTATTPHTGEGQPEFELHFCYKCFQMTNHIGIVCQKCGKENKTIGTWEGRSKDLSDNAFMNGGNTDTEKAFYKMGYLDGQSNPLRDDGWVSCEDGLPDDSIGRVLCWCEEVNDLGVSHFFWNCSYSKLHGFTDLYKSFKITHWKQVYPPTK